MTAALPRPFQDRPSPGSTRSLTVLRVGLAAAMFAMLPLAPMQDAAAAEGASANEGITEELIRLLVKHNALPREEAEALIRKMQQQTASATDAPAANTPDTQAPATAGKSGDVRVIYVPQEEKRRMQAEIQQNVMNEVKAENWARPDAFPDWLGRIGIDGDLRVRYEFDRFDDGNSPFFIDYQSINSGAPYDVNATNQELPPLLNTTEDRNMLRARARLGFKAQVSDMLTAGLSFTSGNITNPVSTNQTLGSDFNKLTFVIDRAYLNYRPGEDWSVWAGRMPSPWLSTRLTWDEDLSFDGLALQYRHGGTLSPFVTVGAFPIENTAFDFPSTEVVKESSRDKWLYAAQLGAGWQIAEQTELWAGAAYYYFDKLQGETSSPLCPAFTRSIACDTDHSRPSFLQKGNTLFALRDLAADPNNPNGPQYQYFGLASRFRVLDVTAKLDMALSGPLHLRIEGAYVTNLAYSRSDVLRRAPVNNFGLDDEFDGGANGYYGQVTFGHPAVREHAQWNVTGGYRYIESDALVATFTDSDFHLGGTNTKGFVVGGSFGLTHNSWLEFQWLSGTEASGAPLAVDVMQLDLNARF